MNNIMKNKGCEKCGNRPTCPFIQQVPDIKTCGYYTESPYVCSLCGKHIMIEPVVIFENTANSLDIMCESCYTQRRDYFSVNTQ